MGHPVFLSKLFERTFCLVLLFTAAAASFNGYYAKWHFRETGTGQSMQTAGFAAMVDGTAERPFVYRQLLPALANSIDACFPEHIKDAVFEAKDPGGTPYLVSILDTPVARDRTLYFRYCIVFVAVFLFAWFSVYAMFLAGKSVGYPAPMAAFAAISLILLIPYFMTWGGYLYDYPELAFFALAFWMAWKFDWWWIIPIAGLGTWNKESFLFFIPTLYPLLRRRCSRPSAMAGIAVLGSVSAAVYFLLRQRFHNNPGGTVQFHLKEQIYYILHPLQSLAWEKTYSIIVIQSFHPLTVAVIALTVWGGWRHLPRAVQRHAQIAFAINFPLYMLFCAPGELRDLSLLYMSFLLLVGANLTEWMGQSAKDANRMAA